MVAGAKAAPLWRMTRTVLSVSALALLAACATTPEPKAIVIPKAKPSEYFSEKDYGVKASPRVTQKRSRLKRGGGRYLVGKPYQVRGKWYKPQEMTAYHKAGMASWYGAAFHGRLTANGEIYDMTALSAAHPTMPLPSYARVTNVANGASVIVRVNDRGPYHGGRIMDLSKRAAELLDYTTSGTAKIDVQYLGPAPIDGNDVSYLEASYRPGNARPDPSDGLPTGVMVASAEIEAPVALAGATPSGGAPAAFPAILANGAPFPAAPVPAAAVGGGMAVDGAPALPEIGPLLPERPPVDVFASLDPVRLGYAAEPASGDAFAALSAGGLSPRALVADDAYVEVGTFADERAARRIARALEDDAEIAVDAVALDGRTLFAVTATPRRADAIDTVLSAAWAAGAGDAFVVRD